MLELSILTGNPQFSVCNFGRNGEKFGCSSVPVRNRGNKVERRKKRLALTNKVHSNSVIKDKILKVSNGFEYAVVIVLLVLLMIVVLLATIGLLIGIVVAMHEKLLETGFTHMQFTMPLLREVFTGFLMILIGLELMKTIAMYLEEHIVHVEVVLSVAMIAIARHVIDMDLTHVPALNLIGIGVIIFALAIGYYYFKRSVPETPVKPPEPEPSND